MAEDSEIIMSPIRMKIEEGAKGELKLSIAIDAIGPESEQSVSDRIVNIFFETKKKIKDKQSSEAV